jgi:hypothetical protein
MLAQAWMDLDARKKELRILVAVQGNVARFP